MKKKMHKVFSLCSFYNNKKKGDSWNDGILRDFRRHYIYPAIAILFVAIVATLYLCYIGG